MKKFALTVILVFSAVLFFTACSSQSRAELKFEGNRSVGDSWGCDISPDGVVCLVSNKYRMLLPLPGMGGTFTIKFAAIAEGEAEVALTHYFRGVPRYIATYTAVVDSKKNLTMTLKDSVVLEPPSDRMRDAKAAYDRGIDFFVEKDYDSAIIEFSEAIKLDPDNANAYWFRGEAYIGIEDLASARADFEAALNIDPNHESASRSLDFLNKREVSQ